MVTDEKNKWLRLVLEDMNPEQLTTGIRVCHRKTGNKYLVTSANMRMKDSEKGWIDAVVYAPLYKNDHDCFCRERQSFIEEFDALEKRYTFSVEEVQKARAECLQCPDLAGSGYCKKIKSDSIVFKYEKCEKIAAALEE